MYLIFPKIIVLYYELNYKIYWNHEDDWGSNHKDDWGINNGEWWPARDNELTADVEVLVVDNFLVLNIEPPLSLMRKEAHKAISTGNTPNKKGAPLYIPYH